MLRPCEAAFQTTRNSNTSDLLLLKKVISSWGGGWDEFLGDVHQANEWNILKYKSAKKVFIMAAVFSGGPSYTSVSFIFEGTKSSNVCALCMKIYLCESWMKCRVKVLFTSCFVTLAWVLG